MIFPRRQGGLTAAYNADKNTLRLVDAYARFKSKRGDRDAAIAAYEASIRFCPIIRS